MRDIQRRLKAHQGKDKSWMTGPNPRNQSEDGQDREADMDRTAYSIASAT
jgi:hypothetical protein